MNASNLNVWWPKVAAQVRSLIGSRSVDTRWTSNELKILVPACEDLSDGLTRDRGLIGGDYLADPELLAAYLALYWPGTFSQAETVLSIAGVKPTRTLDLGCGAGSFVAAALDAGAENVLAVDLSTAALAQGASLIDHESVTWKHGGIAPLRPRREFDVITVGNALNELKSTADQRVDLVRLWMKWLAPGGRLIIVEPALRETTRALLQIRDEIVDEFRIEAPCIWTGPCPALDSERDWCHGSFPWAPPDMVRQLAKEVGVKRDHTKMAYLVLSHRDRPTELAPNVARVVSEPRHTKGRLRYFVCGGEGRFGLVAKERQAKKDPRIAPMKYLPKGSVVEFGETEVKGDGRALLKESYVKVVGAPTEPWP